MLSEASADGSGLLGTKIKGQILLILVSFSQNRLLLLWHHRRYLRYRLPHNFSAFTNTKSHTFLTQINTHSNNMCIYRHREREKVYILESLLGAPPVTLATRRRASSDLSSFNCANRSALDFCLSSWTLILAV